ncbi:MAG: glycosyltransferase family 9 protein [Bacteroidota bacterium]
MNHFKNILVIQTAFIGDAVLATALVEKLHQKYSEARIYFLVRKGNESLFENHPFIAETLVWNKQEGKYISLIRLLKRIRSIKFDLVVNAHRFSSSGFLTVFSGAKIKAGFNKNPFSFMFDLKKTHEIGNGKHEIERNHSLISDFTDELPGKVKLYPSASDFEFIKKYQNTNYYCIAPASVWYTKKWPEENWIQLCDLLIHSKVYILGAKSDSELSQRIIDKSVNENIVSLGGSLSLLQSAALMQNAKMNFVNDSGPLHLASAVNAPVTAIFCSTVKEFGFYPLSDVSYIAEVNEKLNCRPCGLHGYKLCPEGHFRCGKNVSAEAVLNISET